MTTLALADLARSVVAPGATKPACIAQWLIRYYADASRRHG